MAADESVADGETVALLDNQQGGNMGNELVGEDDSTQDDAAVQNLPTTASTTRRAAVAWWVIFCGPVVVTLALLVVGIVADRQAVVFVFTIGVWAYSLTLGLAAAPRIWRGLWWIGALAVAFASAGAAFGLLYAVSELSGNLTK